MTLTRKTPLKRTGFKRKPDCPFNSLTARTPIARSAPMKRRARKSNTSAERNYLGFVAALGCAVCRRLGFGETPAVVHHQRTSQGWGRAEHFRTVPLCPAHHQGSGFGVHDIGRQQFAEKYGFSEVELVEETRTILAAHIPEGC